MATIRYGDTNENMEIIRSKAEQKKDGVYQFRGVVYRVSNKLVTHIACRGKVLERCGYFNVEVGQYRYICEAVKLLKSLSRTG